MLAASHRSAHDTVRGSLTRASVQQVGVVLAPVPALVMGVLVMRGEGVSQAVWGLNVAAAAMGVALAVVALRWSRLAIPEGPWRWGGLAALLVLLGATLFFPGVEGVHRWLPLGPVRVHGGALLLPPLLVALGAVSRVPATVVALAALFVLLLQPDAAQAASFCAGWVVIMVSRREENTTAVILGSLALAVACLFRPDPLEPVPHVEGIVGMAAAQGAGWAWGSLLSLAVMPVALAVFMERPVGMVLAVYTAGTFAAAWLGDYPVPVLGYGVSPILGYFGAVALYALVERRGGGAPKGDLAEGQILTTAGKPRAGSLRRWEDVFPHR